MTPELKAKWTEALLSGKWCQTKGELRDHESGAAYCCLGVLLQVAYPQADDPIEEHGNLDEELPAQHACKELGITSEVCGRLSMMNDGGNFLPDNGPRETYKPHSFAEIAEWIEKNL